ncbi:MAG: phosphoribosylformylglycinamidine cyclo-ligase [Eubacteriales bacterium]|nr:phosphoribosylformylglycinamidine cyclo-ligase [Eubacteriales bacterium]MDO5585544.1 phosphoribosylformylglycinamidine cyclo-ligase [Clostridia bacterium]MDY4214269.1 phosphoribosylformylglycinamidine cyclo-ligase [Eubacteriales bacterium]
MSQAYKNAGVDVEAGYKAVELMKQHVKRTNIPGVLSGIGGFGGLFEIGAGYKNPVLVSGTDGVGTKLKLAFIMDKHDTVGQDCVAMCVNDIACGGAKPLFFLDYIAVGKNVPEKVADIVKGVADGCVAAGCALIGGETAEMPGFYDIDEYDLAGFSVGIVDKDKIIDGSRLESGNVIIGVKSSGVHSNGYSLVRKVFDINNSDECSKRLNTYSDELGMSIGEALLTPTKIYVKPLLAAIEAADVRAVSHITGGGFYENIPRMLKDGTRAKINKNSVDVLPIFNMIQKLGDVSEHDMFNTYNMGIGLMLAVSRDSADAAIAAIEKCGESACVVGEITDGEKGVDIC